MRIFSQLNTKKLGKISVIFASSISISVGALNSAVAVAPVFTTSSSFSVAENTTVVGTVDTNATGETFEVLATNRFNDQMFVSSPVAAAGELFLRSATHLFCISDKKETRKEPIQ